MQSSLTIRRAAGLLALLVALSLVPLAAARAQDRTVADLDLIAADIGDPLEISLLFSRLTFGSAQEAVIATSTDGADALSSGSLQSGAGGASATDPDGAAISGRPLFFVDPAVGPEQALLDELSRLGTTSLILLGGTSALPSSVEEAFNEAGLTDITRVEGTTRIGTAVAVAAYLQGRTADVSTAFLSRAFGTATDTDTAFADSSALGGWAAATGRPILLTSTEALSEETQAYLETGAVSNVVIIGGEQAVSGDVAAAVQATGVNVTRVAGETRDTTATGIAAARGDASANDADRVIITEGFASRFFLNAFAAAAHSGLADAPVLLSNGGSLSPGTEEYLSGATFALASSGLVGLCGTDLPAALCQSFASDIGATVTPYTVDTDLAPTPTPTPTPTATPTPTQIGDFPVTPQAPTTVQVSVGEDRMDDGATYTATGLDPDTNYRISLVVKDNITIRGDQARFVDADDSNPSDSTTDTNGNGQADAGPSEEIALITAVNGTALETPAKTTPAAGDDPAAPTAHKPDATGKLTVTLDATDDSNGGTVYVVIYVNGGTSTFLEVDDNGTPTEDYGVSGPFNARAVIGDLDVAPHNPETVQVDLITGMDGEEDQRTYSVSGLRAGTAYRITLVPAANITIAATDDRATFVEAMENGSGTGVADSTGAEDVATIVMINGQAVTSDQLGGNGRTAPGADDNPASPSGILPVNGVITFTIDGTDATLADTNPGGTIRPVVYVNGGTSTFLEIDDTGRPTEVYGVGGAFTTTALPAS